MENKILNLLKKIIKEDEDTFIDITDMDDDSAAETVISKKDIFKKLRDKMSDKDRTSGGYEYGEIVSGQMGEELHGGQSKIDVASPKGKITADDFKKLRDGKKSNKSEVGENIFKKMFGKKEDPEVAREKDRKENPSLWDAGYEYVNDIVGWQVPEPGQSRFRDPKDKEIEEGNEFSNSRCKAICDGEKSFSIDGKTYPLKGVDSEDKKSCGCKSLKENKVRFTEEELIDLIEKLVSEEKEAPGIAITKKNLKTSKEVNDESLKDTNKKMKEYLKDGSKEEYNPNPQHFPKGNGELAKMDKMAYVPSEAVDEYEDAFAYPGQTNLRFDEIKPVDEKIDMYLKGDSKTGNAQKNKEGKDLGNAVSSKVGDKFKKNYDENLYGAEQADASYKRQSQPVDVAGENKQSGGLKKGSTAKAQKIMNQLESIEDKKSKIMSEEMDKMKNLIGYNRKTQ